MMINNAMTNHANSESYRLKIHLTAPPGNSRESSGNHLHRGATVPELEAHFQPHPANSRSHDNVGHWYEAQLIHYGLPPSRQKAVAKMRLFDAVQSGRLTVPGEIAKIEKGLKKEWRKKHKDARAGLNNTAGAGQPQEPIKNGKKRKREDESTPAGKRSQPKKPKEDRDSRAGTNTNAGAQPEEPVKNGNKRKKEDESTPGRRRSQSK